MTDSSQPSNDSDVFPHDRVVFFSDAVFAIAITLLAIELKAPSAEQAATLGKAGAMDEVIPVFVAFVVSFFVTAQFWVGHMQAWKQVTRTTGKLVWLSLLELMFVALMPFATKLYSESWMHGKAVPFAVYCVVVSGVSLFAWLTRRAIVRSEVLESRIGAAETRWFEARSALTFAVFAACIPLAFVIPSWLGGYLFFLIFPLAPIVKRWSYLGHVEPLPPAA